MVERLVIALGGHALVRPGQGGTIAEQRANLREALAGVVELIREGHRVLITHGNGPQIGHIMIRAEEARGKAYDLPLDVGVAQSQGETGYLIQRELQRRLASAGVDRPVVSLVTQVRVDPGDPRLREPSKPVGPVCDEARAAALRRQGAAVLEDPGRGLRRHVPSPRPVEIVEAGLIAGLFDD
ncbi:MAG TPA: hypothetical protein VJB14_07435 [Planctomycetota bacterium]|nr:hypothetical protein [Planctomycetota bacterium]